jgi:hypothetical protein
MVKINSEKPEPSLIRYAADQIRAGEVLGMPTDTFYGLAADPFNLRAVERVYEIKSRSRHKPLSLLICDVEQAESLAKPLPQEFYVLAKKFWPGPLTIIVKAASRLPLKVTANTGNVALRVPKAQIPLISVGKMNAQQRLRCAISWACGYRSLWMAALLRARPRPPSSISRTKRRVGRSFVREQYHRRKFLNFSRRGDRDGAPQFQFLAVLDGGRSAGVAAGRTRRHNSIHCS